MLSIKNSFFIALILIQASKLLISADQHPPYDLDAMETEQRSLMQQHTSTLQDLITEYWTLKQQNHTLTKTLRAVMLYLHGHSKREKSRTLINQVHKPLRFRVRIHHRSNKTPLANSRMSNKL